MRISWVFAGGIAGAAFMLSALTAVLAGVPFGVLLVRAVIGAVLFGGIGIVAELLVQQQLPELYSALGGARSGEESEPDQPSPESGGNVDIVLDSDDEEDGVGFEAASEGGVEGSADESGDADEEPGLESEELVEEVVESGTESAEEQQSAAGAEEEPDPAGKESVDDLPDIGEFSDTFDAGNADSETSGGSSSETPEEGPRGSGNEDPAVIARAIQTVLKRDE